MAYKDLQDFIKELEKIGELKRIKTPVSANLEITEITDRISKQNGPALLFENVEGSDYPVLMNAFGSEKRMAMSLGVNHLDEIADRITDYLDIKQYMSFLGAVKSLPKLAPLTAVIPRKVKVAECQEVVEDANLDELPILTCWPQDGGPYMTLPLVITKDPETGQQNMGMYRLQKYDAKTTGMHWHLHKDGKMIYEKHREMGIQRMPVSVAFGCDPATTYAATAPLPKMIDEMLFSGFLRKKPLRIVKSVTNDIYVPANAEFVLEGYVDLDEKRLEGPFGDHTGYYSLADEYPVFHVEKVTRRRNPVYPATIVGKPPMEDCYMAKATERIFLPLMRLFVPEIIDMNLPLEGVFHNCCIVSIEKKYPKHAHKIMQALWGLGQMMYTKMIIVVDHTVDVQDVSTVMWKVFNNIDPRRDLVITDGPLDALDHSSPTAFHGSRLGIDATKKTVSEGHPREWPDDIEMDEDIVEQVTKRWAEYGLDQ
jgi:4-hydroxy-3-polyprenylbenzoate decarboxylase